MGMKISTTSTGTFCDGAEYNLPCYQHPRSVYCDRKRMVSSFKCTLLNRLNSPCFEIHSQLHCEPLISKFSLLKMSFNDASVSLSLTCLSFSSTLSKQIPWHQKGSQKTLLSLRMTSYQNYVFTSSLLTCPSVQTSFHAARMGPIDEHLLKTGSTADKKKIYPTKD